MTTLSGLIERVQECDGGADYQLTRDIAIYLDIWTPVKHPQFGDMIKHDDDLFPDSEGAGYEPALLESLDAVVALVEREFPEAWWNVWHGGDPDEQPCYGAKVQPIHKKGFHSEAKSPALALLLAFLRAKEGER